MRRNHTLSSLSRKARWDVHPPGCPGEGTVLPFPVAGPTLGTPMQTACALTISSACHIIQMTKKIKKLEKETTMYRSRWESSNKALLEMAEEVG